MVTELALFPLQDNLNKKPSCVLSTFNSILPFPLTVSFAIMLESEIPSVRLRFRLHPHRARCPLVCVSALTLIERDALCVCVFPFTLIERDADWCVFLPSPSSREMPTGVCFALTLIERDALCVCVFAFTLIERDAHWCVFRPHPHRERCPVCLCFRLHRHSETSSPTMPYMPYMPYMPIIVA
jgi:hypothetical protein